MYKFLLILPLVVLLSACQTTELVGEKAADLVVKRGNSYCEVPQETREKFRERVRATAEAEGGPFKGETIICEGDE